MNKETKQVVETLQEQADKEGITRQAIWFRSEKGKAYRKAYQKSDAYKAYRKAYRKSDAYKAYQKAYRKSDAYKENYQRRNKLIKIALKEYNERHN